jgi:pSer/pThr/pTyr-binding forkhead associated (FHA) protein
MCARAARTVKADPRRRAVLRGSEGVERFEIGEGGVIGRDNGDADFQLDHPHVSRRHARISVEGKRVVIADLESSNGTFVNRRALTGAASLVPGDRIDTAVKELVKERVI